jgi:small subunit ribosomal protein S3
LRRKVNKIEERKFVALKKEEYAIKEFVKRFLGKGKVSKVEIEYTPVGEKVIMRTSKPGLIIGRGGEKINNLTTVLKKRFKFENPHIEIQEISNPNLDAQAVADEIAMNIETRGSLKFKIVAYRLLKQIVDAGALGVELRLSGKLPSARARTWRFTKGYLKKVGDSSKVVDQAIAVAQTKMGTIGIQVSILHPDAKIHDKIDLTPKGIVEITPEKSEVEIKTAVKVKSEVKENE